MSSLNIRPPGCLKMSRVKFPVMRHHIPEKLVQYFRDKICQFNTWHFIILLNVCRLANLTHSSSTLPVYGVWRCIHLWSRKALAHCQRCLQAHLSPAQVMTQLGCGTWKSICHQTMTQCIRGISIAM